MANVNPPKKNQAFDFHIVLRDNVNFDDLLVNPTIAAGDFQISKDYGAFANLATLPVVTPSSSVGVKVSLSATEMNADVVLIVWQDQTAPKEWASDSQCILTTA